jgi:NAD(P)-dependent dehydrogenase (short-subunit alcohol dehydrogenase family)
MFLIVGGDSEIGAATYRGMKAQGKPVAATTRRPERVAPDRPFLNLGNPLDSWERRGERKRPAYAPR